LFLWRKPSDEQIRRFLATQRNLPCSYPEVGASRNNGMPPGYPINYYRYRLGQGAAVFERATAALRQWKMYGLPWTQLCWPEVPLGADETVAVLVRHWPIWSLNACRIIYTHDDADETGRRFGFAFGTLPGHVESGEERFSVEWQRRDDTVWYELFAFARPRHPLARIGFPVVGLVQRHFARESAKAMRAVVAET
jgi:uncharacterized protein (UPF0548 family)